MLDESVLLNRIQDLAVEKRQLERALSERPKACHDELDCGAAREGVPEGPCPGEDAASIPPKKIPAGCWTEKISAFAERGAIVLSCVPNGNPMKNGYLHYLSISQEEIHLQVGPVMNGSSDVAVFKISREVFETKLTEFIVSLHASTIRDKA